MKPLDFSATKPLKDVSVLGRALFSPSINLNIKDPLSRFLLFPHRWDVYYGSSFLQNALVFTTPAVVFATPHALWLLRELRHSSTLLWPLSLQSLKKTLQIDSLFSSSLNYDFLLEFS